MSRRIQPIIARLSICIASVLTMSACFPPTNNSIDSAVPARGATVRVDNRYLGDMHVYLVKHNTRYHLGVVSSLSEAIFLVPAAIDLDADVQFLTVPLVAGQAHQSELIAIGRGYVVALTIQPMGNLVSLIVKR